MSRRHGPYIGRRRRPSLVRLAVVALFAGSASAFAVAYHDSPASTAPAVGFASGHTARGGGETLRLHIQGTPSPPPGSMLSIDITEFGPDGRNVGAPIQRVRIIPDPGTGYSASGPGRRVSVVVNANEFAVNDISGFDAVVQLPRPRPGIYRSGMIYIGSASGVRGTPVMWTTGPRELRRPGGVGGTGRGTASRSIS